MSETEREHSRAERIEALTAERLDVLVVGGGIVGAGVARDAAMRGLRTGLVEQHDFASGTSSRTSRLLHGGIRYLAQGRVGLVREASREKSILHRIAPHLAAPLPFVFPAYRGGPWPLWQLRIGVKLYDLMCGGRNLGPSCGMNRAEVLRRLPGPNGDGLAGAVRYYDGLTNDARLVLDTLRSASAAGAAVLNYARMAEARCGTHLWLCTIRDDLADRSLEVEARTVVHAAGPWAEKLPQSSIRLRLTKGVHLVIDRTRLPVDDAVVMSEGDRILFAIPWSERVILGTTDTDYDGPLDDVRADADDVDYVLGVTNRAFPSASLDRRDVISTWAGVRPLVASRHGGPSDISRAHRIEMPHPGWLDVAGGKLTTYRHIAQQLVDRVIEYVNVQRLPCRTAELPLLTDEEAAGSGIVPPEPSPELVAHFCRREWAVHLEDVMIRRAGWHYYHRSTRELAEKVAGWMGDELGWDEARREAELARWKRHL